MKRRLRDVVIASFLSLAAGCAAVPREPGARAAFKANNDPLEPLNRSVFAFNLAVDRVLAKPLARGYRRALPREARDALRHFLDNLDEPVAMANCILQVRFKAAAIDGGRFAVNSTVGIAGLSDVATGLKLPEQVGDFGQTLWAWGAGEGPYLIIPLLGPAGARDGVGRGVDFFLDPLRYVPAHQDYPALVTIGLIVADGVDDRARNLDALDEIQRESIDYYASIRSLYRQDRAAELGGGKSPTVTTAPDFYDDPGR